MNIRYNIPFLILLSVSTLAFALPQKDTTEELTVTVYPNEISMLENLELGLRNKGVAVAAVAEKEGMLKLLFWENITKRKGVPPPNVTFSIPGIAENIPLQPLSYVERANMFELTIHQDRLNTAYITIQTRMNDPEQGDYVWHGVFKLRKAPTKP